MIEAQAAQTEPGLDPAQLAERCRSLYRSAWQSLKAGDYRSAATACRGCASRSTAA